MDLREIPLRSDALCDTRTVWVEMVEADETWIFLDGELYLERVGATDVVEAARGRGALPTARCVFVSHGGAAARHDDFVCRPEYNAFLRDDLLPALGVETAAPRPLLIGLSLSALATAFATLACPKTFPRAVCQSPSAWWGGEWLVRRVARGPRGAARYYLSVGSEEKEADVRHAPTEMFQGTSQLDSVTRLAAALEKQGNEVRLSTFAGGHDPACWAAELPEALAWVLRERGPS